MAVKYIVSLVKVIKCLITIPILMDEPLTFNTSAYSKVHVSLYLC